MKSIFLAALATLAGCQFCPALPYYDYPIVSTNQAADLWLFAQNQTGIETVTNINTLYVSNADFRLANGTYTTNSTPFYRPGYSYFSDGQYTNAASETVIILNQDQSEGPSGGQLDWELWLSGTNPVLEYQQTNGAFYSGYPSPTGQWIGLQSTNLSAPLVTGVLTNIVTNAYTMVDETFSDLQSNVGGGGAGGNVNSNDPTVFQRSLSTVNSVIDDGGGNASFKYSLNFTLYDTTSSEQAFTSQYIQANESDLLESANNLLDDGDGNAAFSGIVTAGAFNPVSDRNLKENILPVSQTNALAMINALPVDYWNFKARTNWTARITRSTNAVHAVTVSTNLSARIFAASERHAGPMAQDWQKVTGMGNGTNIDLEAEVGLCEAAIQALSAEIAALKTNKQ